MGGSGTRFNVTKTTALSELLHLSSHRHVSVATSTVKFIGCVHPKDCRPGSHGHVTIAEICKCGVTRFINRNGKHKEKGAWK